MRLTCGHEQTGLDCQDCFGASLSARVCNALWTAKVRTLREAAHLEAPPSRSIKNFGPAALGELRALLMRLGVRPRWAAAVATRAQLCEQLKCFEAIVARIRSEIAALDAVP